MTPLDQAAEIRRLFFAEHWKVGTSATQFRVHEDVLHRIIGPLGPIPKKAPPRPSVVDPYQKLIEDTLETDPRLTATRN